MAFGPVSRRQFLQTAAAGSALAATSSDRPNIIFLMADEHRYDALNCLGNSTVHSPNLDRMASQGVRFTHTDCQGPLCQPSRASIMTGRYPHLHGQTFQGEGKSRDVVHSELAGHQNKGNFFVMAANERYRYTYDKENKLACELYDLEKDHDEMHNLVDEPALAGIRKDMHKDYVLEFMNS